MQALHKVRNPVADPKRQGGSKLSAMRNIPRKPVRQFGDYCFDYIEACKHNLQPNKYDDPYQSCPLCKLTTIYTNLYFKEEEEKRLVARQVSLQNRAKLRIKLLYLWSKCQNAYYYNRYPQYNYCIDMMLSMTATELMIAFESVFEAELEKNSNSSSSSKSALLTPKSIIHPLTTSKSHPFRINLPSLLKNLDRYYRIIEVGHFAAVRIQACVRRYLTLIKMRYHLLERFEYIPATRTQPAFFYDNWKQKKWFRYPMLLKDETPATPRTIQRRIKYEQRKHQSSIVNSRSVGLEGNPHDEEPESLNVLAHDYQRIQYVKQFTLWYDLILCMMYRFGTLVPMTNPSDPSTTSATTNTTKDAKARKPLHTSQAQAAAAAAANQPKILCPVWVVPSAPGMSSRDLGLTLALETLPSPAATPTTNTTSAATPVNKENKKTPENKSNSKTNATNTNNSKKGGGAAAAAASAASLQQNTAYLNRTLMLLEQAAWMSLQCNTPEEVLHIVVASDLIPVYESVVNFAQDEFAIWNPNYQILPTVAQVMAASLNSSDSPTVVTTGPEVASATSSITSSSPFPIAEESAATLPTKSQPTVVDESVKDIARGEVLPLRIQLRPCHYLLPTAPSAAPLSSNNNSSNNNLTLNPLQAPPGPSGCFRIFIYDQELIGISAMSPWVYYPEIVKHRDQILSTIRLYINSMEIKTLIQEYYRAANRPPTESTVIIRTPSVEPAVNSGEPNLPSSKKKPLLLSSTGSRKKSTSSTATPTPTPTPTVPTIDILYPTTSSTVFVPPEHVIFPVPTSAATVAATSHGGVPSSSMSVPSSGASISTLGTTLDQAGGGSRVLGYGSGSGTSEEIEHKVIHDVKQYTEQQMKSLQEKYKFISKHRAFAERYQRIQYNEKRRQQKQQQQQQSQQGQSASTSFQSDLKAANPVAAATSSSSPIILSPDIQAMRNIFQQMKPYLQGETVYQMLAPTSATTTANTDIANNTTNAQDKSTTEWTPYQEKLFSMSVGIDGLMERRVTTTAENKVECFRDGQLLVMDVYVTLPKPKPLPAQSSTSRLGGLTRMNSNASLNSAGGGSVESSRNTTNAAGSNEAVGGGSASAGAGSSAMLPIAIHQIIGVFCCSEEKAGANLDCGLFDYEEDWLGLYARMEKEVQQQEQHGGAGVGSMVDGQGKKAPSQSKLPRGNTAVSVSSTITSASSLDGGKTAWSTPNASSGISTYRQPLPSGKEFQMRIIGNYPSREYLEGELPKKIKLWLGLPV